MTGATLYGSHDSEDPPGLYDANYDGVTDKTEAMRPQKTTSLAALTGPVIEGDGPVLGHGISRGIPAAVSIAAFNLYDMCKSVDRAIRIEAARLVGKSGDTVLE